MSDNRYIILAGDTYYPPAGTGGVRGIVDTPEEAHALLLGRTWRHGNPSDGDDWFAAIRLPDGARMHMVTRSCPDCCYGFTEDNEFCRKCIDQGSVVVGFKERDDG